MTAHYRREFLPRAAGSLAAVGLFFRGAAHGRPRCAKPNLGLPFDSCTAEAVKKAFALIR